MIGNIVGEVLFSDGHEAILMANSGVGHEVFCHKVLPEGSVVSLFISHIVKETSEDLYSFETLREKKMFELLISVKGVGPKSAFNLVSCLGVAQIINAVTLENKKVLTSAPGIGNKAASQMLLDLCGKVQKIMMYSNRIISFVERPNLSLREKSSMAKPEGSEVVASEEVMIGDQKIINEALMACAELGFRDDQIIPVAQRIMQDGLIKRSEQLVHLVLKEI